MKYIFDFDDDIYGETIRMEFHHYVRGDMKLNGLDELKAQIARDKESVKRPSAPPIDQSCYLFGSCLRM